VNIGIFIIINININIINNIILFMYKFCSFFIAGGKDPVVIITIGDSDVPWLSPGGHAAPHLRRGSDGLPQSAV